MDQGTVGAWIISMLELRPSGLDAGNEGLFLSDPNSIVTRDQRI
jgi:hypothetical protein